MSTVDRLIESVPFFRREARKCARGKAFLAASIMQVAAMEAELHAMCFLFRSEVKKTGVYARKRFRSKRSKTLDFSLKELIEIAEELLWFPCRQVNWGGKRAALAGFSQEVREIRNHVHPGVWARKSTNPPGFTKGVYEVVSEVVDVANSWLLHRINRSLAEKLARRG